MVLPVPTLNAQEAWESSLLRLFRRLCAGNQMHLLRSTTRRQNRQPHETDFVLHCAPPGGGPVDYNVPISAAKAFVAAGLVEMTMDHLSRRAFEAAYTLTPRGDRVCEEIDEIKRRGGNDRSQLQLLKTKLGDQARRPPGWLADKAKAQPKGKND